MSIEIRREKPKEKGWVPVPGEGTVIEICWVMKERI